MLKKIRLPLLLALLILFILSLSSMALVPSLASLQDLTATPAPVKIKPTPTIPLEAQAGNTNGVTLLGALVVAIIVIPVMLYNRKFIKKPAIN